MIAVGNLVSVPPQSSVPCPAHHEVSPLPQSNLFSPLPVASPFPFPSVRQGAFGVCRSTWLAARNKECPPPKLDESTIYLTAWYAFSGAIQGTAGSRHPTHAPHYHPPSISINPYLLKVPPLPLGTLGGIHACAQRHSRCSYAIIMHSPSSVSAPMSEDHCHLTAIPAPAKRLAPL